MTVKELIEELLKLPGDLELYIRDTSLRYDAPTPLVDCRLTINKAAECGPCVPDEGKDIVVMRY